MYVIIWLSVMGCIPQIHQHFFVNWRKAIRRMFKLRYRTDLCLLHLKIIDLPVDGQIHLYYVALSFSTVCIQIKIM